MLGGNTWTPPAWGTRSFDLLPATVERLLTGKAGGLDLGVAALEGRYDHVVLIYFDAFGWRFAEQHGDHPLLRDAIAVERLTSQFPSTTTVHTPTIHSGLPVGEHGLYEWFVLEPSLNRLVTPLLFCFAGDDELDGLTAEGISPTRCSRASRSTSVSPIRGSRRTWHSLRRSRTRGRVAACCVARPCIRS